MKKLEYTQFKQNSGDPDIKDGCGKLIYLPNFSKDESLWFIMNF
jgi:hypothetical protein